jgi:molecular chaperone DnaK
MKDKITSDQKSRLESEISKVEDALKTNDTDKIKSATEGMNKVWNEIAQQLYQQQGPTGQQAGGPRAEQQQQQQASQEHKKDDREVQDASYEVVDDK